METLEQNEQRRPVLSVTSSLMVLGAAALLIWVCGTCYPELGVRLRTWIAGLEGNAVQEAFAVLTEGLEEGRSVKEALSDSLYLLWEYVR